MEKIIKSTIILTIFVICLGLTSESFAQGSRVAIYRMFNSSTNKHLVAGPSEASSLVSSGWTNEGTLGYLDGIGSIPVYRYFNSSINDHYCSTSSTPASGYVLEGVLGYSAATGTPEFIIGISLSYAVTSYYRNSGGLDHFYTRNPSSEMAGVTNYTLEGVCFYAYTLPY